ncbi:MAG: cobalamin B12-binding domain-containing protein [Anaerolineae bacterium]
MNKTQKLTDLMVNLEEKAVLDEVKRLLSSGGKARDILDALTQGMNIIGEKYGAGEYFLAELVMGAEIFKESMELLEPALLEQGAPERKVCGKMVIGTVQGDLHDIGKNIFVALARNAGFAVTDLGIDVPPAKFIAQIKADGADILGMSGIMTMSLDPMAETVRQLKEVGLRDKVKVIIGGLPVDERWRELVGADAASDDAYKGLKIIQGFMGVQ